MARNQIHTVFENGEWQNRLEGYRKPLSTAPTKEAAIEAGRLAAREHRAEHLIHNADGTIGVRNCYRGDWPQRAG